MGGRFRMLNLAAAGGLYRHEVTCKKASITGRAWRLGAFRWSPCRRRLAFHVFVAATIAGDSQLKRLQRFLDAVPGRGRFNFRIGFDLPPFAREANAPFIRLVFTHGIIQRFASAQDFRAGRSELQSACRRRSLGSLSMLEQMSLFRSGCLGQRPSICRQLGRCPRHPTYTQFRKLLSDVTGRLSE